MSRVHLTWLAWMVVAAMPLLAACGGGGGGSDGSNYQGTLTFVNNTDVTFNCFSWRASSSCEGGEGTCWGDHCTGDPDVAGLLPLAPGQTVTTPPFDYGEYSSMILFENSDFTGWKREEYFVEIDQPNFVVDIQQADLVP